MKYLLPILLGLLAGCQCTSVPSGGRMMERTDLYFGMSRPDGKGISDDDFRAFVNDTVTPRFPDGLTLLNGQGQWKDPKTGVITKEDCRVIILLYDHSAGSDRAIEEIRAAYKKRFDQESVLRADEEQVVYMRILQ